MDNEQKILFWNIGKKLTAKKLFLLKEGIQKIEPDIFCVAEGGAKKTDTEDIVKLFTQLNYFNYYSPLFSTDKSLNLNYRFQRLGLKVFVRDKTILKDVFSYSYQRENGRIVVVKISINYRTTTYIFLHNKSKSGVYKETLEQISFISKLKEMLEIGKVAKKDERVVLIGDFNLEPWDRILKHKKFLSTSFFENRNSMKTRTNNSNRHFYNPIVKSVSNLQSSNLGGTYYSNNYDWALFDYVLYETKDADLDFEIISEYNNGSKLIDTNANTKKSFIKYDLDHLPILIKIQK